MHFNNVTNHRNNNHNQPFDDDSGDVGQFDPSSNASNGATANKPLWSELIAIGLGLIAVTYGPMLIAVGAQNISGDAGVFMGQSAVDAYAQSVANWATDPVTGTTDFQTFYQSCGDASIVPRGCQVGGCAYADGSGGEANGAACNFNYATITPKTAVVRPVVGDQPQGVVLAANTTYLSGSGIRNPYDPRNLYTATTTETITTAAAGGGGGGAPTTTSAPTYSQGVLKLGFSYAHLDYFEVPVQYIRNRSVELRCGQRECTDGCSSGNYRCSLNAMRERCLSISDNAVFTVANNAAFVGVFSSSSSSSGSGAIVGGSTSSSSSSSSSTTSAMMCRGGMACGTCAYHEYLQSHCVVIKPTTTTATSSAIRYEHDASYQSCNYPFATQLYGRSYVEYPEIIVRKVSDPYLAMQRLTKGTGDFGIDNSKSRKTEGILMIVFGSLLILAAIVAGFAGFCVEGFFNCNSYTMRLPRAEKARRSREKDVTVVREIPNAFYHEHNLERSQQQQQQRRRSVPMMAAAHASAYRDHDYGGYDGGGDAYAYGGDSGGLPFGGGDTQQFTVRHQHHEQSAVTYKPIVMKRQ